VKEAILRQAQELQGLLERPKNHAGNATKATEKVVI
jgi:hypothetical protein